MELLRSALSRAGNRAKSSKRAPDPATQQPSDAKRNEPTSPFHRKSASADLATLFGNVPILDITGCVALSGNPGAPTSAGVKLEPQEDATQWAMLGSAPQILFRDPVDTAPVRNFSPLGSCDGTHAASAHHAPRLSLDSGQHTAASTLHGTTPGHNFACQTRSNALDPSQLDPKRAKRIVANRQSAHRSRMKKLQNIHTLEEDVRNAVAHNMALMPEAQAAATTHAQLISQAAFLSDQLTQLQAAYDQECAQEQALRIERARLKALTEDLLARKRQQQTTTTGSGTNSQSQQQQQEGGETKSTRASGSPSPQPPVVGSSSPSSSPHMTPPMGSRLGSQGDGQQQQVKRLSSDKHQQQAGVLQGQHTLMVMTGAGSGQTSPPLPAASASACTSSHPLLTHQGHQHQAPHQSPASGPASSSQGLHQQHAAITSPETAGGMHYMPLSPTATGVHQPLFPSMPPPPYLQQQQQHYQPSPHGVPGAAGGLHQQQQQHVPAAGGHPGGYAQPPGQYLGAQMPVQLQPPPPYHLPGASLAQQQQQHTWMEGRQAALALGDPASKHQPQQLYGAPPPVGQPHHQVQVLELPPQLPPASQAYIAGNKLILVHAGGQAQHYGSLHQPMGVPQAAQPALPTQPLMLQTPVQPSGHQQQQLGPGSSIAEAARGGLMLESRVPQLSMMGSGTGSIGSGLALSPSGGAGGGLISAASIDQLLGGLGPRPGSGYVPLPACEPHLRPSQMAGSHAAVMMQQQQGGQLGAMLDLPGTSLQQQQSSLQPLPPHMPQQPTQLAMAQGPQPTIPQANEVLQEQGPTDTSTPAPRTPPPPPPPQQEGSSSDIHNVVRAAHALLAAGELQDVMEAIRGSSPDSLAGMAWSNSGTLNMLGDAELLQLMGAGGGLQPPNQLLSVPASARNVLRGDSNSSLMAVGDMAVGDVSLWAPSVLGGMSIDAGLDDASMPMLRLSALSIPLGPGDVDAPVDPMQVAAVTGTFARLSCHEEPMPGGSPPL